MIGNIKITIAQLAGLHTALYRVIQRIKLFLWCLLSEFGGTENLFDVLMKKEIYDFVN